jgi:hypothetical protein
MKIFGRYVSVSRTDRFRLAVRCDCRSASASWPERPERPLSGEALGWAGAAVIAAAGSAACTGRATRDG